MTRGAVALTAMAAAMLVIASAVWLLPPSGDRVVAAISADAAHDRSRSSTSVSAAAASTSTDTSQARPGAGSASSAGIGAGADIQDYGQRVLAAIYGGTPRQAAEAVFLIDRCDSLPQSQRSVQMLKDTGQLQPAQGERALRELGDESRLCQSITAEMAGQMKPLAERALLDHVPEIAAVYGRLVKYAPEPAMRQPLVDGLRADFLAGEPFSALALARHHADLGVSNVDARAYELTVQLAFPELSDLPRSRRSLRDEAALTDDERRQAQALAAQWVTLVKHPETRTPG